MADDALTEIGARSTTLWERVDLQDPCLTPPQVIEARLSRWRHLVADDDAVRFRRYLRWLKLDDTSARRALAVPRVPKGFGPEWLATIDLACRRARAVADDIARGRELTQPLASPSCEELMAPFVSVARQRLAVHAGTQYHEITDPAHRDLEAALRARLARIAGRPLVAEFAAFRSWRAALSPDSPQTAVMLLCDADGNSLYRGFVRHVLADGYAGLFRRHPVLARLMAACVEQWVAATAALLAALTVDRPALEATFGGGLPLGPVVEVAPDLSDRHRSGRTVCRVRFGAGVDLVYKPHGTGPEATFESLVAWLNDRGLPLALKAARTLDRGTHGWSGAIARQPCADAAERAAYGQRAGMLLCLAYVLGSSDLHRANVIGSGSCPVLVDLEVLLSARPRLGAPDGDSVLRVGLLPTAHMGRNGVWDRRGALASTQPPVCATDVEAGFRDMFLMLLRHRRRLTRADGPLAGTRYQRYRVILRSTALYASLLDRALHPTYLRDGAEWSIELEPLNAAATRSASRPALWPALVSERVALERLDIPIFEMDGAGTALHTPAGGTVARFSAETAHQATRRRLARLDDDELTAQAHLIRVALGDAGGNGDDAAPGRLDAAADARGRRVSAALTIFRRLRLAAFESADEITWIAATRARGPCRREISALDWDLFGGRAGIALFFAAVGATTAEPGASALACRVLQPLVRRAHIDGGETWRRRLGIAGLGGVVYALARAGQLAGATPLVDAASRLARQVTSSTVGSDRDLDVVRGSAGALLGLLALHDVSGDRHALDRARWCARRLLAAGHGRTRQGVAHGSAGIAYSIARLHSKTGEARHRDFVIGTWRDHDAATAATRRFAAAHVRLPRASLLRHSWCRGTSGAALSRMACARLADAPHLLQGIDRRIQQMLDDNAPVADVDHACCGQTGRICVLRAAAHTLARPQWTSAATAATERMLDRVARRTAYTLGLSNDLLAPGFFQGLAGIGYELLRGGANSLPAVLLLE